MISDPIHAIVKKLIRKTVDIIAGHYRPLKIEKLKHGWKNKEIEILYNQFDEMIQWESAAWTPVADGDDYNRKLYHGIRDIVCVLLDEDTHYILRFFYFIELINRDYDKYNIEMHNHKAYWNWEAIKKALLELSPNERNPKTIAEVVKRWQRRT